MAIAVVDFKNITLEVNNDHELYIRCGMWHGSIHLNDACIIIDIRDKTKLQMKNEAKNRLEESARHELENAPPVYDVPDTFPDFQLSVDYEE